jgi:hypothetical protein
MNDFVHANPKTASSVKLASNMRKTGKAGLIAGGVGLAATGAVAANNMRRNLQGVQKDLNTQRRYSGLAEAGAATGLGGAGLAAYSRGRVKGVQAADKKALSALWGAKSSHESAALIAQRDMESARTARTAARAKEAKLVERWSKPVTARSKTMMVPTYDRDPAFGGRQRKINRGDVSYAKPYRQGRAVHRAESLRQYDLEHKAQTRLSQSNQAADEAKRVARSFTGTAPKVARLYGRLGKVGMVAAGAGALATAAGITGVERNRHKLYKPAAIQPRFAPQAAVGRKQEISHEKAKGAAYRAGLPAGKMSREEIDSWYVKAPGER